jgi:CBS domain-containing protein
MLTMRHRIVGELMTSAVVQVGPDTPFKEIAQLFTRDDVTVVPVVDDQDRPLGVVCETDLLCHEAVGDDPAGLLPPARLTLRDRIRARATTAEGLMTSPAVCARPEWTVVEAARLMDGRRLKRLLVIDEEDRLIGIVSRGDLLRVFLRPDRAIEKEIREEILADTLGLPVDVIDVEVHEGQITLTGTMDRRSLRTTVVKLCRGVDGVVAVTDRLSHRTDDSTVEDRTAQPVPRD